MVTKAKCQARHAARRSLERYGFEINQAAAIQKIQAGKARFIERQSLRITLWEVEAAGKRVKVVYDSKRKTIVTALPADEISEIEIIAEAEAKVREVLKRRFPNTDHDFVGESKQCVEAVLNTFDKYGEKG